MKKRKRSEMASQRPHSLPSSGGKTHVFFKLDISGTKDS